jgi:hypothetical protein
MLVAEALVPTDRASRYLVQLCRHANHMSRMRHQSPTRDDGGSMPPEVERVDYSDADGVVRFAEGQWFLRATADTLTLRVEAADDDTLRRLQDGIADRLEKIGRRDQVTVAWHRPETPPALPGDKAPSAKPAAETGTGKRRWRGRLGAIGVGTGGALVVALHLGLGGAVLAAAPWIGWTSDILGVIILVKVVVIAGHVVLGRFALRNGKDLHGHWKLRAVATRPHARNRAGAAADGNVKN